MKETKEEKKKDPGIFFLRNESKSLGGPGTSIATQDLADNTCKVPTRKGQTGKGQMQRYRPTSQIGIGSGGDIDWQRTYGGNDSNSAIGIRQTSDGGYVVARETAYFGAGDADACMLKLETTGEIGSGSSLISTSTATAAAAGFTVGTSSATVTPTTTVAPNPTFVSPLDSWATTTTP